MKSHYLILLLLLTLAFTGGCVDSDNCDGITCDSGSICNNGKCVLDDKCKGIQCPTGESCSNGKCVLNDKCATVKCSKDFVCVEGVCVPTSDKCQGVSCSQGFACIDGTCVDKCATVKCAKNFVCIDGTCVPEGSDKCENIECSKGFDCVEGECIDRCISIKCTTGTTCIAGECVPNEDPCAFVKCSAGAVCIDGLCVHDKPVDACEGVICIAMAKCEQGVCVTDAMRNIEDLSPCDPETFVDFCDGRRSVYCDKGIVVSGDCDEGCVVYQETFFGRPRQRSGCIDGGTCKKPNELKRECITNEGKGVIFAKACQLTTQKVLNWISVDGYYCSGVCDAANEKCALQEKECDPYDYVSECDRQTLTYCHLDADLVASKRTRYCDEACISVGKQMTCGYACKQIGDRKTYCQTVNVQGKFEQTDYICTMSDSGQLYSVWTGEYELCIDGCDNSLGVCK